MLIGSVEDFVDVFYQLGEHIWNIPNMKNRKIYSFRVNAECKQTETLHII